MAGGRPAEKLYRGSDGKTSAKAFYGCEKLAALTFKTAKLTKSSIGSNSFGKIFKTVTVKLPKAKFKSYRSWLKNPGKMPADAKYQKIS